MYCRFCGNEIKDNMRFCGMCGAELIKEKKQSVKSKKKIIVTATVVVLIVSVLATCILSRFSIADSVSVLDKYVDGAIVIQSGEYYGLMDYAGNIVEPCIYEEITGLDTVPKGKIEGKWVELTQIQEMDEFEYICDALAICREVLEKDCYIGFEDSFVVLNKEKTIYVRGEEETYTFSEKIANISIDENGAVSLNGWEKEYIHIAEILDDEHAVIIQEIEDDYLKLGVLDMKTREENEILGTFDYCNDYIFSNYDFGRTSEGLVAMRKNGKCGYINSKGEEVIPLIYDSASDFSEGLAAIGREDSEGNWKYGYINSKGEEVIPLIYDSASDFSEGLAVVVRKDSEGKRKCGYINSKGEEVVPLIYDNASEFNGGLAEVVREDNEGNWKCGYINSKGEEVIPLLYDDVYGFSEGLSVVVREDNEGNRKCGYINGKGEEVIPLIYDSAYNFSEGLAAVGRDDSGGNRKYGHINNEGEEVIPLIYDSATEFIGGLAMVHRKDGEGNWKYGFVNSEGELILPCMFDNAYDFFIDETQPSYLALNYFNEEKNQTEGILCKWPLISEEDEKESLTCLRIAIRDKKGDITAIKNPKGDVIVVLDEELDKCNEFYRKAVTYYQNGKQSKAIKMLQKALKIQSENTYMEQLLQKWS